MLTTTTFVANIESVDSDTNSSVFGSMKNKGTASLLHGMRGNLQIALKIYDQTCRYRNNIKGDDTDEEQLL